jgi:transcriptional regulator with XRE-family HTH domain
MREGSRKPVSAKGIRSRLPALLRARELSRSELGRLADLSDDVVRRLLRADSNPPLEHALRVSHVLGVEVEELFALEVARRAADAAQAEAVIDDPPEAAS